MPNTPFPGMRDSTSYATDEHVNEYDREIYLEGAIGTWPLTALSRLNSNNETTDTAEYNWWYEDETTFSGVVTGVYTDMGLTSALSATNSAAGTVLYVKIADTVPDTFRVHQQVAFKITGSGAQAYRLNIVGEVLDIADVDATYYRVTVRLMEADTGNATYNVAASNYLTIVGSMFEQGSTRPDPISWSPYKDYNYTQILRASTLASGTALAEKNQMRTEGTLEARNLKQALAYMALQEERFAFSGVRESTTILGKPRYASGGLLWHIKNNCPAENIADFETATGAYASATWADAGITWLREVLEPMMRYAQGSLFGLATNSVTRAFAELSDHWVEQSFRSNAGEDNALGMVVNKFIAPYGTLVLKTHPDWNRMGTEQNTIYVFEPKNIVRKVLRPLKVIDQSDLSELRDSGLDAKVGDLIQEVGWKFPRRKTFGILYGVGRDNTN